jgi:N-acetylglutamate synthase-like GNAT family acetyltransferase
VIVRDFEERDRDACARLFQELVETHRTLYPGADIGGEFGVEGRLFVAEDDDEIVGYAGLIVHTRLAELEPIVVAQNHRGKGVGTALARQVAQAARQAGVAGLFVRPAARNREAIAFFQESGFDRISYIRLEMDFEDRDRRAANPLEGLEFDL